MTPVRFFAKAVFSDATYQLGYVYGFAWKVGGRTRIYLDKYAKARLG